MKKYKDNYMWKDTEMQEGILPRCIHTCVHYHSMRSKHKVDQKL